MRKIKSISPQEPTVPVTERASNITNEKDTPTFLVTIRPSLSGQPSIMVMKSKTQNKQTFHTSAQTHLEPNIDQVIYNLVDIKCSL